jgi:hypothetical protein
MSSGSPPSAVKQALTLVSGTALLPAPFRFRTLRRCAVTCRWRSGLRRLPFHQPIRWYALCHSYLHPLTELFFSGEDAHASGG